MNGEKKIAAMNYLECKQFSDAKFNPFLRLTLFFCLSHFEACFMIKVNFEHNLMLSIYFEGEKKEANFLIDF